MESTQTNLLLFNWLKIISRKMGIYTGETEIFESEHQSFSIVKHLFVTEK